MQLKQQILFIVVATFLVPAPLSAGKIDDRVKLFSIRNDGGGSHTLTFTTSRPFRFWVQMGGKVYRVGYRDGEWAILNALKNPSYILEHYPEHIVQADGFEQLRITVRSGDGESETLTLDTDSMRLVGGSSSSGGSPDEEDQDTTPGSSSSSGHDISRPICELTGTCTGSSGSSSSSGGSSSSSGSSSGGSTSGGTGGWTPSPGCPSTIPAGAIRPTASGGKIEGSFPSNSVINLSGMTLNVTPAARSGVVLRGGNGLRITGGRIVGPAPVSTPWSHMKKHPVHNNGYDGDGVLFKGAGGIAKVDHMVIDNMMDALSFNGKEVQAFEVCSVYARGTRDDFIEDDACHDGLVRDTLVDGTHMFISARPGHESRGKSCAPKLTIEDSLVSIECQAYNGDMKGNKDRNSCNGTTTGLGQLFKTSVGGPTVNAKNTIFMVEDQNEGGTPQMDFPRGTYQNVTVVWLGGGEYPGRLQPGIAVTTNRQVWENAKAAWLRAHGCDADGDSCAFTRP